MKVNKTEVTFFVQYLVLSLKFRNDNCPRQILFNNTLQLSKNILFEIFRGFSQTRCMLSKFKIYFILLFYYLTLRNDMFAVQILAFQFSG